MGPVTFFTNREGEIFVEGIEAGRHEVTLDGSEEKIYINVTKDERGMKNLGQLQFTGEDE
jgi:hypothetical protein